MEPNLSNANEGVHQLNILGMHRSGTSLTAQWLHRSGLFLGSRLLGSGIGNSDGHFEDLDFIEAHDYALKAKQNSLAELDSKRLKRFQDLAAKKSEQAQWGWKDPRTCMFVDVWEELLPGHKQLIVYRDYANVADSLVRKSIKLNEARRNKIAGWIHKRTLESFGWRNECLESWILNNQRIVDNLPKRDPESYLLVHLDKFTELQHQLFRYMTSVWGFDLQFVDYGEVYKSDSIVKKTLELEFDSDSEERAKALTSKLEEIESETLKKLESM